MFRSILLRWLLGPLIALLVASPIAAIACVATAPPMATASMVTRGDCNDQRSRPACAHGCDVVCTVLAPAPFALRVGPLVDDLRYPVPGAVRIGFVDGPEPPPPRN